MSYLDLILSYGNNVNESLVESSRFHSNGYEQYNDTDIKAVRLGYAITVFAFIPFHIGLNLLVILAIYLFKNTRTIQSMLVVSASLHGMIYGMIYLPVNALYWIPQDILYIDKQSKYKCISFFIPYVFSGMCTMSNMAMIAGDRFFAIVYPIKYSRFMNVRKACRIITAVWVYCVIFSLVPYLWNDYGQNQCEVNTTIAPLYAKVLAVPQFAALFLLSAVCNGIVSFKAYRFKQNKKNSQSNRLSLLLQLSYLIIYVPFLLSLLVQIYEDNSKASVISYTITSALCSLYYTSAPLIYMYVHKQARRAVKYIVTNPPWKWNGLTSKLLTEALQGVTTNTNTRQQIPTTDIVASSSRLHTMARSCCETQMETDDGGTTFIEFHAAIDASFLTMRPLSSSVLYEWCMACMV